MTLGNGRLASVDITPHPRILRMLGEIAFEPHKCIGEFIDNSIDGFLRTPQMFSGTSPAQPQISIIVPHKDIINTGGGEVVVEDNGPGMTLQQLVNAAKVGYSASSPIENLGLFGMGFNIATARLGGMTEFRSGVKGESSWSILQIDLSALQKSGTFVIVPRFEHKSPDDHGTRVTIQRLRQELVSQVAAGVRGPTKRSVAGLRQWIGRTYTRFLREANPRFNGNKLAIVVNGEQVEPYRWCVWSANRCVEVGAASRLGEPDQILAFRQFDQVLGGGLYCLSCLSWQPENIQLGGNCAFCREQNLVERVRKIKGWIGIQRHLHEEEYGLDFLRNGRAILQWDKRVFTWTDPATGRTELEYPIDEARARHGRIVGEVEIDHVPVHYQKDSFEEDSWLWKEVLDNLRGTSPLRPQVSDRRNMPRNESLLQPIYRGFNRTRTEEGGRFGQTERRRREKWSRDLIINQDVALEFHRHFLEGNPDYQSDDKWFGWMTTADAELNRRERASAVVDADQIPTVVAPPTQSEPVRRTEQDELRDGAELNKELSGTYGFEPARTIDASVYQASRSLWRDQGTVKVPVPVLAFPQLGGTAEVFFDPTHPRVVEDQIEVRDLVIAEMALALRERYYERFPYSYVYDYLKRTRLPDYSRLTLTKQATRLVAELYPRLNRSFNSARSEQDNRNLKDILTTEEIRQLGRFIAEIGGDQTRLDSVLGDGEFLKWIPHVMSRIVRQMPERFLDNKLFALPLRNLPTGLSEGEREELGQANASLVANLLEDLANATRSVYGNNGTIELLSRKRAFASVELIRELLVEI